MKISYPALLQGGEYDCIVYRLSRSLWASVFDGDRFMSHIPQTFTAPQKCAFPR